MLAYGGVSVHSHGVFDVSRRIDIHDLSQCSAGVRWLLTHYTLIHSSSRHLTRVSISSTVQPATRCVLEFFFLFFFLHPNVGGLCKRCWREEKVSFSVVLCFSILFHLPSFICFVFLLLSSSPVVCSLRENPHGFVSCTLKMSCSVLCSCSSFPRRCTVFTWYRGLWKKEL